MKPLVAYCPTLYCCLLFFCSTTAKAQNTSNKQYYIDYYTGCWQTNNKADGNFVTKSDLTFQWIKPANNTATVPDTLRGRWCIKSVYSIPFKTDVIVLKFSSGKKKKYQIGTSSSPAVIFLPGDDFFKVPCK
ncbi:hypothetical protein [Chitinophaga barathri]|uniref:hypothetical protein n=1 Tax=Chitinophaga barathri TaxID=1647451 RepID=UPI000EA0E970|nr:hypothetical protein [Chitinophaga barathri]